MRDYRLFALSTRIRRTRTDHGECPMCAKQIKAGAFGVVKLVGKAQPQGPLVTAHFHGECYEATCQVDDELVGYLAAGDDLRDVYPYRRPFRLPNGWMSLGADY